ncbi:Fanconi anemia group J protein, partial [Gonapodya sp. JEL0774]
MTAICRTTGNDSCLVLVFQDGLGDTILRLIRLIPAGVLVFLPSYSLIEKLVARWEATGVFGQMKECKEVYLEPKGTGKGECDQVIKDYQTSLRVGKKGAMIFAVYRGKLSEGIDFSDDQSRAVIGVGIPYANARDPAVVQKKKYNDSMASLGIMNGGMWYEIQAFRALNQALGRTIRHRKDWGAVILLDSRFQNDKQLGMVSRWLRSRVVKFRDFPAAEESLTAWLQDRRHYGWEARG